jgi:hypothetical protein
MMERREREGGIDERVVAELLGTFELALGFASGFR